MNHGTTADLTAKRVRRVALVALLVAGASVAFAACGNAGGDNPSTTGGGPSGTGATTGAGGSGAKSGSGGKSGTGTGGGAAHAGTGAGGGIQFGGNGGTSAGGTGNGGTGLKDGGPAVDGETCASDVPDATITRMCRPPTDNECDGMAPAWEKPGDAPGMNGNGFDDDCDGLVDEGCTCNSPGTTKDCYLVPSSQTTGMPDWKVQGWCDPNAHGKETCKVISAEQHLYQWGGDCSGAQPPYPQDVCSPGDYNCDGVPLNPPGGCACTNQVVQCPTEPLVTTPFPDPTNIGQFKTEKTQTPVNGIDGMSWINPKAMVTPTNWRWEVVGGPCDDILPNPTFAMYPAPQADFSMHLGAKTGMLPQTPQAPSMGCTPGGTCGMFPVKDPMDPQAAVKQGWVVGSNGPSKVYPAFSLSGDYYVTGRFQYTDPSTGKDTEGQCTQVVHVRAPGLRVELCWPEVGTNKDDNDVDLHLARMNNPAPAPHGWFTTAGAAPPVGPGADDCYYSPNSACSNRIAAGQDPMTYTPQWGYSDSSEPGGVGVCHGWGSRRFNGGQNGTPYTRPCSNPRLDRDNIDCDPSIQDPNSPEADPNQVGDNYSNFCGPENINLDDPNAGDKFAIGVECYACVGGQNSDPAKKPAHPRVNVYCNGELKLGFGYDPAQAAAGMTQYPQLITEGGSGKGAYKGAIWNVAMVTWKGDPMDPCDITPVKTNVADPPKDGWHDVSDGSNVYCVQNGPGTPPAPSDIGAANSQQDPAAAAQISWPWPNNGAEPADASGLCPY